MVPEALYENLDKRKFSAHWIDFENKAETLMILHLGDCNYDQEIPVTENRLLILRVVWEVIR